MNVRTLEQPVVDSALDTRFRVLLEHYRAPIARLAGLYERERAAREDLVQDIWLAVWRALPRFRGDCSERTFIYRIAHNRALTHVGRRRGKAVPLDEALDVLDPGASLEDHLQADDDRARLLDALRRLSPVQREVVLLTLEGLPQRDIAQVLGVTEPNVAVRLSRARAELTRRLAGRQEQ
jgi:RNA polymerase sigma-70 factor (ECF subfamily)